MKIYSKCFAALAAGFLVAVLGISSAMAAGIASEGKSLGGLSDRQCLSKVDRVVAAEQRAADNLRRVVRGSFTRRMIFSDGSVDFACFPNQVVIIVYFSNAGNQTAEKDLRNFLRNF